MFAINLSQEEKAEINTAEKSGKIIRFIVPKGGIPIYPGKDLKEKIEALKKKRKGWLRRLTRTWRA